MPDPERFSSELRASVAIPVRNGGALFAGVLAALATQTIAHELIVCDSGSTDGSRERARECGARVIEIAPECFGHGSTRNLLMDTAAGTHVALLTQDAQPTDARWLERMLAGFKLAGDVALAYGPYRPRADAGAPVRLALDRWFRSLSPDGTPQIERLSEGERSLPAVAFVGRRGFFTDANACIARAAWERVPFREVPYAEDRVLALDMLRAGYAKAFLPDAAVVQSRALLEVYSWREPSSPAQLVRQLRGELSQARRQLRAEGVPPIRAGATLAAVARHHALARAGALLGSRADRLPPALTRRLSLEGRAGCTPLNTGRESKR
jgi:glycosyltransferase involved in cell wall biosynthesis